MKKSLVAFFLLTSLAATFAFPPFDPFADATAAGGTSYPEGANLGTQRNALGDRWYNVNTAGTAANLTYLTNVSLTYPGLPALGGRSFVLRNVAGPGARMFTATTSAGFISVSTPGKAYYSLLMKVADVTHLTTATAGDFVWGFNNQSTIADQTSQPSDLHARIYLRKSGSGYQIGIAKTTSTTFDTTVHSTSETLFLVVSYEVRTSTTTDDIVQLWVNPSASSFGAAGPTDPPTVIPPNTDADQTVGINSFTIENRATTTPDLLLIDDFRMGTNWTWVTGGSAFKVSPIVSTNVFYGSNFSLSFTPLPNGTPQTFQWQKDGINLVDGPNVSGSTTTNLTISNAGAAGIYSAVITGLGSVTNSTTLTLNDPWFVKQPANTNAAPGSTVTFAAIGTGTPSLSYRWQQNGVDLNDGVDGSGTTISGSHTATLILSTIGLGDSGSGYACALTNGLGSGVVSSSATLTVNDPAVTADPQNTTVNYLGTANFVVGAAGSPTLGYRWQLNGNDLADGPAPSGSGAVVSGASTAHLQVSGVTYLDRGGSYVAIVSNAVNTAASATATLGVNDPYFSTQPANQTNMAGTTATLSAVGSGSGALTYQWFFGATGLTDNTTYSGSQTATLSVSNVNDALAGVYTVTVIGLGGSVTSSNTTLVVLDPVSITSQPAPRKVHVGDNVAFVVGVVATSPSYQWLSNGTVIAGATSVSYLLTNVQTSAQANYSVIVSNVFNSQTSSPAALTVSTGLLHLSPANLVITRLGDGAQTLSGSQGNTLFLDQFTVGGQYLSSIMIPDNGTNALIISGAGNDGITGSMLYRSTNQLFMNFAGYNVSRPFVGTLSADATLAHRSVGAVNGLGYYTLQLGNSGLYTPNRNFRGAISTDGTSNYWTSGSAGGVKYLTPAMGPSGVPQVSGNVGVRGLGIFSNTLYYVNVAAGQKGVHFLPGPGLPMANNSTTTPVISVPDANSPTEFAISPDYLTIYLTDDSATAGGIQRWDYDTNSLIWNLTYTLSSGSTTGARGLLVDFSSFSGGGSAGTGATLYATTGESSNNRLVTITDTGSGSAATVLASSGPNQLFRGVAFGAASVPVSVAVQPLSQSVAVGDSATFTATASGSAPFSYQWQRFGTNIPGATLSSLTLTNLQIADSTTYTVVAGNDIPSSVSSNVVLTVTAGPPVITFGPRPRTVRVGDNVTFVVAADGTDPLSYQWKFNSSPIGGATGTSYSLSNVQLANSGLIGITVTNIFGTTNVTVSLNVSNGPLPWSAVNLAVAHVGDGIQALDPNLGNTLSLDQLTTAGTYVNSVIIPGSGPSALIVEGGIGNGLSGAVLSRSDDQHYLNFAGYNVTRPFTNDLSLASSAVNAPRCFGGVNALGYYTLILTNTGLYTPNRSLRGAVSTDGLTQFWSAGSEAGVKFLAPYMLAANVPQVTFSVPVRATIIFGGNVWFSSTNGLYQLSGLPTNSNTGTLSPTLPTGSSSPNDFAISPDGRTIYFADDRSIASGGGIQRWDDFSFSYTLATGTGSSVGAHGLVVDFSGFTGGGASGIGAVLYATTSEAVSNRLMRVTDNGSGSAAVLLGAAGPNQAFRGVTFGPAAAPLAIASQPQDHTSYAGGSVVFSVTASGDAPFSYQWKFFGTNLPGATQASLALTNVQSANVGGYLCTVTDLHGASMDTRTATLSLVTAPTTPYAVTVLQDHPIAYWRLDESSGATFAHDCVGSHDGTYYSVDLGLPGYNDTDPDTAAFFGTNGIFNSYVGSVSLDLSGSSNAAFTVEAWFNGGPQNSGAGIITLGYGNGGEQFDLDNNGSSFRFFVREANATSRIVTGTIGADGNWHHLVGVCDQANAQVILYVDGVPNATNTAIIAGNGLLRPTGPLSIGARRSAITSDYNLNSQATIDEVAIYASALSPARIAAHFAAAPVLLTLQNVGGQWQLTWPGGGALQAADQVTGPYTNIVGATSPFQVTPVGTGQFFRVQVH